jgi:hypothetical protein
MKYYKYIFILLLVLSSSAVEAGAIIPGNDIATIDNPILSGINAEQVNFAATNASPAPDLDEISGLTGQVWSEALGWISFSGTNYGVGITCDSGTQTGTLTGFAWGEGAGFINFEPTNGGVTVGSNGVLDGTAWIANAGWLVFDSSAGAGNPGYVQFDFQCSGVSASSGGSGGGDSRRKTEEEVKELFGPTLTTTTTSGDGSYHICEPYLKEFIKLGDDNNPQEVNKLIDFLNEMQGENLVRDGSYDQDDFEAVKRFQDKYKTEVLDIWGLNQATGYVYKTTRLKINSFYCKQDLQCPVFTEFNDFEDGENLTSEEIKVTKGLLADLGFYNGPINQNFDRALFDSLIEFQEEFSATMLKPWGLSSGTGYKYKTTNKFLNFLVGCDTPPVDLDGRGTFDY